MELTSLYYRLRSLTAYRPLLEQPVLRSAVSLLDHLSGGAGEPALDAWAEFCFQLEKAGAEGPGSWLLEQLRYCDAPWPRAVESGCSLPGGELSARRDLETFSALSALDSASLRQTLAALLPPEGRAAAEELPLWTSGPAFDFDTLSNWYRSHGAGPFARYRAFLWEDGQLLPVPRPDSPGSETLMGYRLQRAQVEANTRALLAGRLVNNVLLFGDSGTGKSATVKSLLSLPGSRDLRLIEIEKNSVAQMPQLIRSLGGRRQKFILFIDDLAFDQDDRTYGVLKTILEGGLEPRPANVAIYATSNRRNLVRQTFSDREGDEVDRGETIQEKTALADRFGLRIPYLGLAKAEYLSLVERLAAQADIQMPQEELFARAVRWDARHPGRSPRTAQQFIASLA